LSDKKTEKYRLFVAIELPQKVKQTLMELQNQLSGVRKVPSDQIHLTIRFIGDVKKDRINRLVEYFKDISLSNFYLDIQGVGTFPNKHHPKVVWAGVGDNGKLEKLYKQVEKAVVSFGEKPENRSFHPHITLGRVRNPRKTNLNLFLNEYQDLKILNIKVSEFILFRSILSGNGARHIPVHSYHLK